MAEDAALKPMSKNFSRVVITSVFVLAAYGIVMVTLWVMGAVSQNLGGTGLIAILAAVVLAVDWVEDRRQSDAQ